MFGDEVVASSEIQRLLAEHDAELTRLTAPLHKALSAAELHAVHADGSIAAVGSAWEVNDATLRRLLSARPFTRALALGSHNASHGTDDGASPRASYDGAGMLVAHLARDWSALGAAGRARVHRPVLRALQTMHRTRRRPLAVFVPGMGAGRLAWEISRMGHRVEANDVSAPMVVAARSLMRMTMASTHGQLALYPRVRCSAGAIHRSACLQPALVPDVCSAPRPPSPVSSAGPTRDEQTASSWDRVSPVGVGLTLQLGSWDNAPPAPATRPGAGVHSNVPPHREGENATLSPDATFDAVVTCYFLDTQADPASAVRRVRSMLAPGGVWLNVGPLSWHEPTSGLLRLTLSELGALPNTDGVGCPRCAHAHACAPRPAAARPRPRSHWRPGSADSPLCGSSLDQSRCSSSPDSRCDRSSGCKGSRTSVGLHERTGPLDGVGAS